MYFCLIVARASKRFKTKHCPFNCLIFLCGIFSIIFVRSQLLVYIKGLTCLQTETRDVIFLAVVREVELAIDTSSAPYFPEHDTHSESLTGSGNF